MAPKKRATKAATESAESTTPAASQETPSTSQPVAVASPAASQTPDAVAEASPSKAAGRRSASAAATVKPAATTVDEASPPKKQHNKAPPAFIDVLVADNIAPAALGAVDMALTADEGTLVVARSNGSLAAYRVLPGPDPEKPIFNFVMVANTGGHANCGISKIALLGAQDEYVVVALCSGQIAVYHTVSLTLAGISPRVGGVIRSIARSGLTDFFAACADGSARRFKINESGDGVVVAMTVPKSISCERALSVAVSTKLGLVVVGDDARTITAFELGPLTAKHMTQKWHMQLPNGYPMAMAISETGNAIAVGTSMNEVLFIDPTIGLVVNTYQHHKGPVTVVLEAAGVFYASGWHESLRAYRAAAASSTNGARPTPATRATAKISASDYCPAEVKRRTHYHECVALAVGLRTGLFLSAARDGTVMFTNLDKLFTHPASYLDSQVSKTPYELCGAGHLLFTHRDAVVHVYRVLPTHLLPLASISLSGDFNVRGVWPNASGTRLCVATDERLIVVALDANLENNTCKVRRLATEAIAEVSSACFPSEHVCCAAVANRLVLIASDDETVNSVAEASRKLHTARRNRALQHRRVRDDQDDDAGAEATTSTTAVKTVYSAPRIQGHIHTMVAASVTNQSCVFVATTAPAAYHFVRLDKHDQSFVDPPSVDATDCVSVRALHTSGDVSFLCPTDGRHWIVKAPTDVGKGFDVLLKKPASLTVARSLLPQNAIALGRYPENPTMCAAAFPNGIVQFQANGERWSYIRQADRAKAEAHNIKTKTEFASLVPSTTTVSPPWAAQPNNSRNKALGLPRKVHRAEAATIALEGQDSDAEGSDDGRGEDPTQLAEGVRERRSDAIFVLRRNIEGMLEGLPNMWRVRRFGN